MVQVINEEVGCKASEPRLSKVIKEVQDKEGMSIYGRNAAQEQTPKKCNHKPPKYKQVSS